MLEMRHIGKSFSGVRVLEDVDFSVNAGEVHVLAGENGAGKSTLIKILSGVHADYEGEILLWGRPVHFATPHDALRHGVAVIHQELSLIGSMTALDNLSLGREMRRGFFMDRRGEASALRPVLEHLGLAIDLRKPMEDFPLAEQQMIELAKALVRNARMIVMDEPTSALNDHEAEKLLAIVHELKGRGCGIVYITHRMEEVYRVADRITVLRDGRRVGTAPASALARDQLVRWMIGREVQSLYPRTDVAMGDPRLQLSGFCVPGSGRSRRWRVEDVSFSVHAGEIVGLAGLEGCGRSELLMGLFGAYGPRVEGRVVVDGRAFDVESPAASLRRGVALLTSDRKTAGLILSMNIVANITLPRLRQLSPWGWRRSLRETAAAERQRRALNIRAASLRQEVQTLSGGNQQKVALAKWLETEPGILLLDEPTRGIDIGAKHEIYELMTCWKSRGLAIVLITSEMPELLAMSDRIFVLHRGRVTAELARGEATQERIVRAAMGEEGPS